MSDQYTYARFWRCALQVNPVGYNGTYRGADHGLDEGSYNQALLQKCLELGIKVVGLADHGSVASVDALSQVLQPHGIVVFASGTAQGELKKLVARWTISDPPLVRRRVELPSVIMDQMELRSEYTSRWSASAEWAHMVFSTGVAALAQLNEGAAVALLAMASAAAKTR